MMYNSAKGTHCCISMSPLKTFHIVHSYIYDNNSDKGMYCCASMAAMVTQTRHNVKLQVHYIVYVIQVSDLTNPVTSPLNR